LADAVELYGGDFLAGFTLRDSVEFDTWQSLETEALRQELVGALQRLVQGCTAQGEVERAIECAKRWLTADPLDEGAHRALMRLYAGTGQQSAALRQFEACERVLMAELGMTPSEETGELYGAIRERRVPQLRVGAPAFAEAPAIPRHNLPPQPTPFVGREEELGYIAERLADPACRLLTVVGPGGIGKSRLAIQAAEGQVTDFTHGVCFVRLAPVGWADLLAPTIMGALDVPMHGAAQPSAQLLNYLRERHLFLILDNFEHLLEGASLVVEVLDSAPQLKVLVTSRERLNLRQEWAYQLRGMRVPEEAVAAEWATAGLEDYSAVQLFVECARRAQSGFSLAAAGASSVARICQLVEGMPLAIELAAPWVQAMPCQDIAGEIEANLNFLAASLRDMPRRHRSMQAVFGHSWELLLAEERSVLRKLSVFRGGFRREAAEAVAVRLSQPPVSLSLLSSLIGKSWLRATPSGRYEMHELIRQYCAQKLETELPQADVAEPGWVRDRHSDYYAAFLNEQEQHLKGRDQVQALESILEEIGNIRAAWDWAVEQGNVVALGKCVDSLYWIGQRRGWQHEVMQSFSGAVARIRKDLIPQQPLEPPRRDDGTALLLGRILSRQGHLTLFSEGISEGAVALCEESLALLEGLAPSVQQQKACIFSKAKLGWFLDARGDSTRGRELLQEALVQATQAGDDWNRGWALWRLSRSSSGSGEHSEAEGCLREAIALFDGMGDQWMKAWCLRGLSSVLEERGEYEEAESLAQEELRIRRDLGDPQGMDSVLMALAWIEGCLGRYDEATRHYRDSLALGEQLGNPFIRYGFLSGMGMIAAAQGSMWKPYI
jgi:predicted ATPase